MLSRASGCLSFVYPLLGVRGGGALPRCGTEASCDRTAIVALTAVSAVKQALVQLLSPRGSQAGAPLELRQGAPLELLRGAPLELLLGAPVELADCRPRSET